MSSLLRDSRGRISWKKTLAGKNAGDVIAIPAACMRSSGHHVVRHGWQYTSQRSGNQILITLLPLDAAISEQRIALSEIKTREARTIDLTRRLQEAQENHTYWQRQQELRTSDEGRAHAAGLAYAWETTAAALRSELNTTATA